jgi:signal transduction histidine kinase
MASDLARHVEQLLVARAEDVTKQWVDLLSRRLEETPDRVLPGDAILNHIPAVLRELAAYLGDGSRADLITRGVRTELGRLADLRRRQGSSLREILAEFELLSALVEDVVVDGVATFAGPASREDVARLVARAKDTIFVLGSETASRFRAWTARRRRERLRLLEGYTAMLSHELGNRLGAAETAVRLLIEKPSIDEERRLRLNGLILDSVHGALETVESVRAIFRGRDQGTDAEIRRLPLASILSDVVHQMRVPAEARGSRLTVAGPLGTDPVDAERLPLVVYNLLGNAIRHHDCHDGTGEVTVTVTEAPDALAFAVVDDGPGIPDEMLDRIFEPHHRGPAANDEGTGLGLAIAREAVEQMGGTIELPACVGRGCTVRFTIPRARVSPAP